MLGHEWMRLDYLKKGLVSHASLLGRNKHNFQALSQKLSAPLLFFHFQISTVHAFVSGIAVRTELAFILL